MSALLEKILAEQEKQTELLQAIVSGQKQNSNAATTISVKKICDSSSNVMSQSVSQKTKQAILKEKDRSFW